jgi:hypothetical protein
LESSRCGYGEYEKWLEMIDLGNIKHCFKCGLSQRICRKHEGDNEGWCEHPEVMLPGIFVLHKQGYLQGVVETCGFQGSYEEDIWEWIQEEADEFGLERERNWMRTWRQICQMYEMMTKDIL